MSELGTLLAGRYRLQQLIGSGASANVYAATDELLQLPVAIKILHDPTDSERQIREATLAMSLNHPAIVRCNGAFTEGEQRFIVMELAEGESLAERLLRGPLALGEAIAVLTSVAQALHHAHERGILHRDIAPGNILTVVSVDRIVGARVIDFGIAKEISTAAGTQTVGIGTAAYAAPEQLAGKPTEQSDLYGLGAVLFHSLAGAPPSLGARGRERRKLPRSTPTWLADLTQKLLAVDPSQRVKSASELLAIIPAAPRRTLSIGTRRALYTFAILIPLALATVAVRIAFSHDARYRAATLCAWLEGMNLITWTDQRVLGTMAIAAARNGDLETLDRLFSGNRMPPERTQWLLADSLDAAISQGHVSAMDKLLKLGAVVRTNDKSLAVQLITEIILSRSPEVLALLVDRGLDMRPIFEHTNSFTAAMLKRDAEMFNLLLTLLDRYPVLPPVSDPPLFVAATSDEKELYMALVTAVGTKIINARDGTGAHALSRALHRISLPIVRVLLEVPELDIEQRSADGSTALIFASGFTPDDSAVDRQHRLKACELLIERGANVNARNHDGHRPLLIAAELQQLELTRLLLKQPRIEINVQDAKGNTPLHRALAPREPFEPAVLKLLLSHGADVDLANAAGETPRQLARRLGREHYLDGQDG